jgi:hypothetical protein
VKPDQDWQSFFSKKLSVVKGPKKEVPAPVDLPSLMGDEAQELPHTTARKPFTRFFEENIEEVMSDLRASTESHFREMYFRRRKAVLGY